MYWCIMYDVYVLLGINVVREYHSFEYLLQDYVSGVGGTVKK